MKTSINKAFTIVAVIVILLALVGILYYFLHRHPVNTIIKGNIDQKTELIKVRDSITVLRQRLLIAENRIGLVPTRDSIVLEALRAAKLNPTNIAIWKSVYAANARTVEMSDSFNNKINEILLSQKNLLLTTSNADKIALQQKFDNDLKSLLSKRILFSEINKYRILKGDIGFDSKLNIIADTVISEPFISFGQKKTFLGLGRPEYSVVIGDKNPSIHQSGAYSATFKPQPKIQFSLGPVGLFDKKSMNLGVGGTIKKGVFSVTVGYSVYNKQFK